MAVLLNSFEGGSSGTTISTGNSGGVSGNAFDAVNIGSGSTVTFSNAEAAHGYVSMAATTPVSATNAIVEWTSSLTASSVGQAWLRAYVYLPSLPSLTTLRLMRALNGSTVCGAIGINPSGNVVTYGASGGAQTTSTTTVPTSQWFRLEGYVIGSASAGQIQVQIFTTNADGLVPDETNTSGSSVNTNAAITRVDFGNPTSVASYTLYMDELGASTVGYVGPVGQVQAWPQQALPGPAWRRRFNLPEHQTQPGQQSVANPSPPTSSTPTYFPPQRAPGQAWQRRFRRHPVPPGQNETPRGQHVAYPQQARPGPTWQRRFRPRAQGRPFLAGGGGGKAFLGLTTSATVVQGVSGASRLALTTSSTPLVVVPGTGASLLALTTSGAAAIKGAGTSHLHLTSAGAAEVAGSSGAVLKLTSASTPVLLVKTLIVSIASQAGEDDYGNAYVQGLGVYGFGELVSPVIVVNSNAGGFFVEAS